MDRLQIDRSDLANAGPCCSANFTACARSCRSKDKCFDRLAREFDDTQTTLNGISGGLLPNSAALAHIGAVHAAARHGISICSLSHSV